MTMQIIATFCVLLVSNSILFSIGYRLGGKRNDN